MSEELPAVPSVAPLPAAPGDEYEAICEALMQTGRGRWFLQEYARRNRNADTEVLLAAIQRIETAICAERAQPASNGFRLDLLEMAKAITRTRAEVADIGPETAPPPLAGKAAPPQSRDVFAAAERIRDVTWAMRGHGFDPSTCDQLEELASSILSARALRDPADHRVSKLSEVLRYLEQRIGTLLQAEAAAEMPVPSDETHDAVAAYDSEPAATFVEATAPDEPADTSDLIEPSGHPPAIEDEAEGLSGSAAEAIEVADEATAPRAAVSDLEAEAEIEAPLAVESKLEAEPEVTPAPEPVAAADDGGADIPAGAPDQDRDLIRVAAVMRLAQVLFEAGDLQDTELPLDVEPGDAGEPGPLVPSADVQPLPPMVGPARADAELGPADWSAAHPDDAPSADAPLPPVKLAWSAAPVQTADLQEVPIPVSALEEALTAPLEETMLPPRLPPAPRAQAVDMRDPLVALGAMSESELIALFS